MKCYYVKRVESRTQLLTAWRVFEQGPSVEESANWRAVIWESTKDYRLRLWVRANDSNMWATVATLPRETPFEEVEEAMYNLLRLGMDTGTS